MGLLFYFKVMLPTILYVHALFFHKLLNLLLLFSFQIRSLLYLELFTFSLLLYFWSAGELKFTKYITTNLNRKKCKNQKDLKSSTGGEWWLSWSALGTDLGVMMISLHSLNHFSLFYHLCKYMALSIFELFCSMQCNCCFSASLTIKTWFSSFFC